MPTEALARRPEVPTGKEVQGFGQSLTINHDTGWVTITNGDQRYKVSLTKPGTFLLDRLARRPGQDIEKNNLRQIVKDAGPEAYQAYVLASTVAQTMLHVRNALNKNGDNILEIESYKSKKGPSSYTLRVDRATIIKNGEEQTFESLRESREPTPITIVKDIPAAEGLPDRQQTGHFYTEPRAASDDQPASDKKRAYTGHYDIFVPEEARAAYLDRHGIEFRPLTNGAFLAGGTSVTTENAHASVDLTFPTAPIFEPPEKKGISHVLEHLVADRPGRVARRTEADKFGAWTSLREMLFRVEGTAHPDVPEYGVWPVIPVLLEELTQPLSATEADLAREKRVIQAEIVNRGHGLDDDKIRNDYFVQRTIFMPGHYSIGDPTGPMDLLNGFTLADVAARHEEFFIPNGLQAQVFSYGTPEITKRIMAELEAGFGAMPDAGRKPRKVDRAIRNTVNPAYHQGELYTKETDRKDGQQDFYLVWNMPTAHLSPEYSSDINFIHGVRDRMRMSFRRQGGYSMQGFPNHVIGDNIFYGFRLRFPTREDPEQFIQEMYPTLRADAFESFGQEDLSEYQTMIRRRSAAAVISRKERFRDAVTGHNQYGKIVDSEKVLKIDQTLTIDDLQASRDRFIAMPPTIFVDK